VGDHRRNVHAPEEGVRKLRAGERSVQEGTTDAEKGSSKKGPEENNRRGNNDSVPKPTQEEILKLKRRKKKKGVGGILLSLGEEGGVLMGKGDPIYGNGGSWISTVEKIFSREREGS